MENAYRDYMHNKILIENIHIYEYKKEILLKKHIL